jgi:excisionase family DNA binding protein
MSEARTRRSNGKEPTAQEQPAADAPTLRISSPPQEGDDDITLFIQHWDQMRYNFGEMPRDPSEGREWMLEYRKALVEWMTQPYEQWHDPEKRKRRPMSPGSSSQLLLTVEQAAVRLNLTRTRVYALMGQGRIQSVKEGKRRLIPTQALERYISELEQANG